MPRRSARIRVREEAAAGRTAAGPQTGRRRTCEEGRTPRDRAEGLDSAGGRAREAPRSERERGAEREEPRDPTACFDILVFKMIAARMQDPTNLLHVLALSAFSADVLGDREIWTKSFQARAVKRRDELRAELEKLGLARRRDSRLCDAYERGEPLARGWSAAQVARKMAEMHYLHGGFCPAYQRRVARVRDEIQREVNYLAGAECEDSDMDYSDADDDDSIDFYPGIRGDACRALYGTRDVGEVFRRIADRWEDWPERWPWLAQ